ncbi:hypothetical protein HDU98_000478 [Podochytrium sp. JEL0797]|nr:hypothetical protein HDU98_000478 [Podochytrium sp. JEL0797]
MSSNITPPPTAKAEVTCNLVALMDDNEGINESYHPQGSPSSQGVPSSSNDILDDPDKSCYYQTSDMMDVLMQVTDGMDTLTQDIKFVLTVNLLKTAVMTLEGHTNLADLADDVSPADASPTSEQRTGLTIRQRLGPPHNSVILKSLGKIDKFCGLNRDATKGFLISINIFLMASPFLSDNEKIVFTAFHFDKGALEWFDNMVLSTEAADNELHALFQAGSCQAYATILQRLITYTDHNDYA